MICLTCGKSVTTPLARECPHCHAPISVNNITNKAAVDKMKNEYDCKDDKLMILSMFLFPYGLYFFYKNRNDEPLRSSSALGGAFLGLIIICIFITFFLVGSLLG